MGERYEGAGEASKTGPEHSKPEGAGPIIGKWLSVPEIAEIIGCKGYHIHSHIWMKKRDGREFPALAQEGTDERKYFLTKDDLSDLLVGGKSFPTELLTHKVTAEQYEDMLSQPELYFNEKGNGKESPAKESTDVKSLAKPITGDIHSAKEGKKAYEESDKTPWKKAYERRKSRTKKTEEEKPLRLDAAVEKGFYEEINEESEEDGEPGDVELSDVVEKFENPDKGEQDDEDYENFVDYALENTLAFYLKEMDQIPLFKPEQQIEFAKGMDELLDKAADALFSNKRFVSNYLKTVYDGLDLPEHLKNAMECKKDSHLTVYLAEIQKSKSEKDDRYVRPDPLALKEANECLKSIERSIAANGKNKAIKKDILEFSGFDSERDISVCVKKTDAMLADYNSKKKEFVERNLRLVVKIANNYRRKKLSPADLIQEGNIGMIRAVEKFDYKKGYRFSSYATWWIHQAIIRALAEKSETIRVPIYIVEKFKKLEKIEKGIIQKNGRDPEPGEIAERMGMDTEEVEELLKTRASVRSTSLEKPVGLDKDADLYALIADEKSAASVESAERDQLRKDIEEVLETMTAREEKVLRMRYGIGEKHDHTLEEIGEYFSLSRERIRQIEKKALKKLRHKSKSGFLRPHYDENANFGRRIFPQNPDSIDLADNPLQPQYTPNPKGEHNEGKQATSSHEKKDGNGYYLKEGMWLSTEEIAELMGCLENSVSICRMKLRKKGTDIKTRKGPNDPRSVQYYINNKNVGHFRIEGKKSLLEGIINREKPDSEDNSQQEKEKEICQPENKSISDEKYNIKGGIWLSVDEMAVLMECSPTSVAKCRNKLYKKGTYLEARPHPYGKNSMQYFITDENVNYFSLKTGKSLLEGILKMEKPDSEDNSQQEKPAQKGFLEEGVWLTGQQISDLMGCSRQMFYYKLTRLQIKGIKVRTKKQPSDMRNVSYFIENGIAGLLKTKKGRSVLEALNEIKNENMQLHRSASRKPRQDDQDIGQLVERHITRAAPRETPCNYQVKKKGYEALKEYRSNYKGATRGYIRRNHRGIYLRLKRANLLSRVPLLSEVVDERHREKGEEALDEYIQKYAGVTRGHLRRIDRSLYLKIKRADMLDKIPLLSDVIPERHKKEGEEVFDEYLQKYKGRTKGQLLQKDPVLYGKLRKTGLLDLLPDVHNIRVEKAIAEYKQRHDGLTRGQLSRAEQKLYNKFVRAGILHLLPKLADKNQQEGATGKNSGLEAMTYTNLDAAVSCLHHTHHIKITSSELREIAEDYMLFVIQAGKKLILDTKLELAVRAGIFGEDAAISSN